MTDLIQFFLVDHVAATGATALIVGCGLKVWMLYTCPSHPLYRGNKR